MKQGASLFFFFFFFFHVYVVAKNTLSIPVYSLIRRDFSFFFLRPRLAFPPPSEKNFSFFFDSPLTQVIIVVHRAAFPLLLTGGGEFFFVGDVAFSLIHREGEVAHSFFPPPHLSPKREQPRKTSYLSFFFSSPGDE